MKPFLLVKLEVSLRVIRFGYLPMQLIHSTELL